MATFTITTAVNIDTLASKAGSDTYNLNGGYLTVDQHTRYGTNQNTSAAMGNITLSATLGGTIEFNSTKVRLIPYDTGTGNVPALGTVISSGGASGILLGVYSALNVAPTAAAAAMPASGYILIRQWNSVSYTTGALTGIGASATAADGPGWLEIVGVDATTCTVNRLNLFKVRGDWYDFQGVTTSGSNATTYQIPSNGSIVYSPGVWVETGVGTGLYEFYPCAGTQLAHADSVATDAVRGKVCWISTAGLIRFQNDGGNSTGGYLPPSGCKIRIPNILFMTCTAGAPTVNSLPNATLSTRYDFTTTGGGVIDIDKAMFNWYPSFSQPYSIALSNVGILTQLLITEVASPLIWTNIGVGQEAYNTQLSISASLCFAGGTISDCVWSRTGALGNSTYVASFSDMVGFTLNNNKFKCIGAKASLSAGSLGLTRFNNSTINNMTLGAGGRAAITTCNDLDINDTVYYDSAAWNTNYTAGLPNAAIAWTRVTTTATITKNNHGLKVGDTINVSVTSDVTAIVTGAKTVVAVPTINTFTFACLNAGAASGTITYNRTVAQFAMYAFDLLSSCTRVKMDGLTFGGLPMVQPYAGILNIGASDCSYITLRNLGTASAPLNMGGDRLGPFNWTRVTTVMTITSVAHGLNIGDIIAMHGNGATGPQAFTNSTATLEAVVSVPTPDTFTITVTNASSTSGTIMYYQCMAGQLAVLAANAAAKNIKIQRCYTPNLRIGIGTSDNSSKNITMESVWGTDWGVFLTPQLNLIARGLRSTPLLTAQSSVYGTHFIDYYTTAAPATTVNATWTSSIGTVTVSSPSHNLNSSDSVVVTASSNTAIATLGLKSIGVLTLDEIQIGGAAGTSSGTLTFIPVNGRVGILMNEPTAETTSQVILTNGATFTSAGGLYMPSVNDQVDYIWPTNIRGHGGFPIAEISVAQGAGNVGNYHFTYSLDDGATYHNLRYSRLGGGGANGSTNVTMTSTAGVEVGDYVFGTNIAPNAKVVSITNATTIVVDIQNIGIVSGELRFNHLPSETVTDALIGFPLRVRIKTTTAFTNNPITSLFFHTFSSPSDREAVYPLDIVPITVTVKDVNTGDPIENARVFIEAAAGGPATLGTDILTGLTNASGILTGTTEYLDQPISGRVRRAAVAYGTLYKSATISSTIESDGLNLTVLMIPDE